MSNRRFAKPLRRLLPWLAAALTLLAGTAGAVEWPKEVTIGYQKYGTLIILKSRGDLEKRLAPHGVKVNWAEFSAGVPLLEGLNAGRVHFGVTGETPPIYGQAARGSLTTYVAFEPPSPRSEALLVRKDSPIKSVADLKGGRIAVAKGSNSHYFTLVALRQAGLTAGKDVQLVFLPPSDARSAFERGDVQAWAIWDYFYAAAEADGARVLLDGSELVDNHGFYLAPSTFLERYPHVIELILEELAKIDRWVIDNPAAAAEQLAREIGGVTPAVLERALRRAGFDPKPITPQVIAAQQRIADTLHEQGLIPTRPNVADAVWHWTPARTTAHSQH